VLFERCRRGQDIRWADLEDVARSYACSAPTAPLVADPLPVTFDLRYSQPAIAPLRVLLDEAEALANEVSRLRQPWRAN
jgi:hypothetical protein